MAETASVCEQLHLPPPPPGAQNDAERAIIADGWRRAGIEIEENELA